MPDKRLATRDELEQLLVQLGRAHDREQRRQRRRRMWRRLGDHYESAKQRIGTACSIKGCPRGVEARGWCGTHYQQWRRTGSPLGVRGKRLPPDELARLRAAVGARPEASERAS